MPRYRGWSFGIGPFRWYSGRSQPMRQRSPERIGYWPVTLLLAMPFGVYLTFTPAYAAQPDKAFLVVMASLVWLGALGVLMARLSKPWSPAPPHRPVTPPLTSAPWRRTVGRGDSWS